MYTMDYPKFIVSNQKKNPLVSYKRLKCSCLASYKMLIFIAFAQKPPLNGHAGVSNKARGVSFGPTML